jgi:ATP-dependent DNA helicase RecG
MKSADAKILDGSVQYVKSIGPKRAQAFAEIGIKTIRDLLFYFPRKHLDRTTTVNTSKAYQLAVENYDGEITIVAKVESSEKKRIGRKEMLLVQMRDSRGFMECVWFQGAQYIAKAFNEGDVFAISAKPVLSKFGNLQFLHPDFDRLSSEESENFLHTGGIIPFYSLPKELKALSIGDFSLRRIIHNAVESYADNLEETLPGDIITGHNLIGLKEAVKNYHYPESFDQLNTSLYRLKFEELFFLEILVALRKNNFRIKYKGTSKKIQSSLIKEFLKVLPFSLTDSQLDVLSQIRKDLESPLPMNRLLQGDVGSGKTVVALIAMLIAVDNGYQAALMAPTEILADQHARNISALMKQLEEKSGHKVKVSLMIGGQKKSVRIQKLSEIEMQEADIIIGTHAIFEGDVSFRKLGVIVVDEQHRFGVAQRALLQEKGTGPDVLVMSATPIPRTLTMTVYGDLDLSIITEMPKNRIPIKTFLRGESSLPDIYKFIIEKAAAGDQSFIVYPLVEESEKLQLKAAETLYEELKDKYLKEIKIGLIHGRMSWQEKEEKMFLFHAREYDALISTTVIEVGIDIPDANIMVINDAQRFGLSQLHQLRGRVGRGKRQAYCILVTPDEYIKRAQRLTAPDEFLSSAQREKYKTLIRLNTMIRHNDGFKIAETDLKLRGPGDIFGIKQSGFPELRFADITTDTEIIVAAKEAAFNIVESDPSLNSPSSLIIKKHLNDYYSDNLKYANIA